MAQKSRWHASPVADWPSLNNSLRRLDQALNDGAVYDDEDPITFTGKVNFKPGPIAIGGITISSGVGSPEGVIIGVVGDEYHRTDAAAGDTLWLKMFGSGNTGWVSMSALVRNRSLSPLWFAGATPELKIQAAIDKAIALGYFIVEVPLSMARPGFTTSSVAFSTAVRMTVEGLDPNVYHVSGYGAPLVGVAPGVLAVSISNAVKQALLGASKSGGGVVSFLGQTGEFGFTSDAWSVLTKTDISPLEIRWAPAAYRLANRQTFMSHHRHILDHTRFVMQNLDASRWTGAYAFLNSGQGLQLITAVGSGTVTIAGGYASDGTAATLNPGQQISIFGHVPKAGRDKTTVGADPGAGGASIQVASTTGFPSSGYLAIPNNAATDYEIVQYTSVDATHFIGCTRGYGGSTAIAHNIGTAVDRCVYEPYLIKGVAGNVITLDESRTVPFTSTSIDCNVGVFAASIDGFGEFDGNMDPAVDDVNNPAAVYLLYASRCYFGPGILYRNWDHSGVQLNQSGHNVVRGRIIDSTRPNLQLGSATWLFGSSRHNDLEIDAENCYIGCYIDSRTVGANLYDGPSDNNRVVVHMARAVNNPVRISGSRQNYCLVESAVDLPATGQGIAEDGDTQWITSGNAAGLCTDNVLEVKTVNGAAGFLGVTVSSTFGGQRNLIISQRPGSPVSIPAGTIIGRAGPVVTGTAILDFGAFPGKSDASVAVVGQADILAGSIAKAWLRPVATADHTADEHLVETINVVAGAIVAGVGFTIYGFNRSELFDNGPGQTDAFYRTGQGMGTRIYGQWTVAWEWT